MPHRTVRITPERVNFRALERMGPDALMDMWARLGCSRVGHSEAQGDLKGYVSNLAAFKRSGAECYAHFANNCRASYERSSRRTSSIRFYL